MPVIFCDIFSPVCLHFLPALVTFCLRWYPSSYSSVTTPFTPFPTENTRLTLRSLASTFFYVFRYSAADPGPLAPPNCNHPWPLHITPRGFIVHTLLYFVWQSAYLIKIMLVDAKYLAQHQEYVFSERKIVTRLKPVFFSLLSLYIYISSCHLSSSVLLTFIISGSLCLPIHRVPSSIISTSSGRRTNSRKRSPSHVWHIFIPVLIFSLSLCLSLMGLYPPHSHPPIQSAKGFSPSSCQFLPFSRIPPSSSIV